MWTWWLAVGSTLSAVAIGIGAFGAHAIKGKISVEDTAIFVTASRYLTTQSLGIILVALCMSRLDSIGVVPARQWVWGGVGEKGRFVGLGQHVISGCPPGRSGRHPG